MTFKILLLVYKILNGLCSRNLELQYKTFNGRDDDFLFLKHQRSKQHMEKGFSRTTLPDFGMPCQPRFVQQTVEKFKEVKTLLFNSKDVRLNTVFEEQSFSNGEGDQAPLCKDVYRL